ncbi:MAG TPA: ABC transporter permease [Candidatus Limnocylindrales bacterium]
MNLERLRDRAAPRLGGFNLTFLAIEIRRLVRNRRTLLITIVVPVILFELFKVNRRLAAAASSEFGPAFTMVGIAVYGSMLAASAGGARVAIERALGWSRQLRLTPLRPVAYIAIKLTTAMLLGLVSVVVVFALGANDGVDLPLGTWLAIGLLAWLTSLVFAALGLFLGYLLPSENALQIIGPLVGVLSLVGGLFVPLSFMPDLVQQVAPFTPTYGVVEIARFPLVGGSFDILWLVNVVGWTAAFGVLAALLFRRDTRRT